MMNQQLQVALCDPSPSNENECINKALKEQVKELQKQLVKVHLLENMKCQIDFWRENIERDMKTIFDHFAESNLTYDPENNEEEDSPITIKITRKDLTFSKMVGLQEEIDSLKERLKKNESKTNENEKDIKEIKEMYNEMLENKNEEISGLSGCNKELIKELENSEIEKNDMKMKCLEDEIKEMEEREKIEEEYAVVKKKMEALKKKKQIVKEKKKKGRRT